MTLKRLVKDYGKLIAAGTGVIAALAATKPKKKPDKKKPEIVVLVIEK